MNRAPTRERVFQLQVDRATVGLSTAERLELEAAVTRDPSLEDPSLEWAATSIELAHLGEIEPLPKTLRSTLRRQADDFVISRQGFAKVTPIASRRAASTPSRSRSDPAAVRARAKGWSRLAGSPVLPWLVATAASVVAVVGWMRPTDGVSPVDTAPTNAESAVLMASGDPAAASTLDSSMEDHANAQGAQLATDASALRIPWTITEDPAAAGARGDLVWNNERQEGFMRFEGLTPNDPAETRYQLWIFDAARDDRFPVDGGLFDVPESGEVVVPIDARLRIGEPVLFAVTIEEPGGVVVSDRERIVVLAQST